MVFRFMRFLRKLLSWISNSTGYQDPVRGGFISRHWKVSQGLPVRVARILLVPCAGGNLPLNGDSAATGRFTANPTRPAPKWSTGQAVPN
jgi:hypothetical protein